MQHPTTPGGENVTVFTSFFLLCHLPKSEDLTSLAPRLARLR